MSNVLFYIEDRDAAEEVSSITGWPSRPFSKEGMISAFREGQGIVALMAAGIVVRTLGPVLGDKWTDPPVVLLTPDLGYAVPLLGGHHGANQLARELEAVGARPLITTATEARGLRAVEVVASEHGMAVLNRGSTRAVNAAILRGEVPLHVITGPAMVMVGPAVSIMCRQGDHFVGIGCNRGTPSGEIEGAVRSALAEAGLDPDRVMAFATTRKKADEAGLTEAVANLGGNLVYIDDRTINDQPVEPSQAALIGLKGVAEPAALAISIRKELVMRRRAYGNVTVAIAR